MPTIILHFVNEDPVLCEIDKLPGPTDTMILAKTPRRRDGKDLMYLEANVNEVIWPLSRLNFIEIIPSGEEEEIISFVRE